MMSFFLHINISTRKPLKLKFDRQEEYEILRGIKIKNEIFVYKLFEKRDKFDFFIVCKFVHVFIYIYHICVYVYLYRYI